MQARDRKLSKQEGPARSSTKRNNTLKHCYSWFSKSVGRVADPPLDKDCRVSDPAYIILVCGGFENNFGRTGLDWYWARGWFFLGEERCTGFDAQAEALSSFLCSNEREFSACLYGSESQDAALWTPP